MRHLVVVMTTVLALAACSHLVPLREMDAAEAKWSAGGIQNYNFALEVGYLSPSTPCSPGKRIDVQVRNGQTVKFGTCDTGAEMAKKFGSVPQIFATIRANRNERPPRYLVDFNSSLGYPERIEANYSRTMTDYSVQYYVTEFHLIR